MTRTILMLATALTIMLGTAAPAAAADEIQFQGWARDSFGRGRAPVAVASFVTLGRATFSYEILGERPVGDCVEISFTSTFVLGDGTFVIDEVDLFCPRGGSAATPGALIGYGAPYHFEGTFTIDGGTGAYAGASGGGTLDGDFAGDVAITWYRGTMSRS